MRPLALAALALLAGCNLDPVRPCQTNADCFGSTTPMDVATRCDPDSHSCVRVSSEPADAGPQLEPDAGPGDWTLTLLPPGKNVGAHVHLTAVLTLDGASYPFPDQLHGFAFLTNSPRNEALTFDQVDGGTYAATWAPLFDGDYNLYVAYLGAPGHPRDVYSDLVSTKVDRSRP